MALGITAPYRWLLAGLFVSVASLALRPAPAPPPPQVTVRLALPTDRVVVSSYLITRGDRMPDCGWMAADTEMTFADEFADNATRRVLVPCAEMPRSMYSRDAGDAPVLEVGALYRLELVPFGDDRWRAERIDVATQPLE